MDHSLMHPPYRESTTANLACISLREVYLITYRKGESIYYDPKVNRALRLSGFFSWRNPDTGSWFIQALCKELDLHGRSHNLLSLMTFVNRRVALEYQSYVPQNEKFHAKKQIPSIVSMLTRLVYFRDKHTSTSDNIDDRSKEKKAEVCEKET